MPESEVDPPRHVEASGDFPPDWPEALAQAHLAMDLWQGVDMRRYLRYQRARTAIWAARRASARAFAEMLAAHSAEQKKSAERGS